MAVTLRRARAGPGDVQGRKLHVSGFKSIRDPVDISLRPLTILAGPNSSGKTSALQPLLLVKQTLEVAYDPGPLLLAGDNVNFSSVHEMLWHGRGGDVSPSMSISYTDHDGELTGLIFGRGTHGAVLERLDYRSPEGRNRSEFTLTPHMSQAQLLDIARAEVGDSLLKDISRRGQLAAKLKRSRCFLDVTLEIQETGQRAGPYPSFALTDYSTLVNAATNLIHLPGLRDNPSRFYPATEVGSVFPGVFQPYVASVIASWGDERNERLKALGDQMRNLGLSWKVESKRIDDTRVALRVGRLVAPEQGGARDLVNIADVGLGVSQTLPVLVALLVATRGQIVYLEQPEIHLHPRAQVALAEVLVEAARRGVVVVAETHSYLLLRGIQELTARQRLTDLVQLHWFNRDPSGVTKVESAELDATGAFGDWPADFADVEMEVEERYVRTALEAMEK